MASTRIRTSPKAATQRGADQLAGGLAAGISLTLQARTRELVAAGLTYDEAQAQAEVECFGSLRASAAEVGRG